MREQLIVQIFIFIVPNFHDLRGAYAKQHPFFQSLQLVQVKAERSKR